MSGRDYAQVLLSVHRDDDFLRLSIDAQWLYVMLLSSPKLSHVGVMEWHPKRLSLLSPNCTPEIIENAGQELFDSRFILIDRRTDELCIKSFIKYDKTINNTKIATSTIVADYAKVTSRVIQGFVIFMLQHLRAEYPLLGVWRVESVSDALAEPSFSFDAASQMLTNFEQLTHIENNETVTSQVATENFHPVHRKIPTDSPKALNLFPQAGTNVKHINVKQETYIATFATANDGDSDTTSAELQTKKYQRAQYPEDFERFWKNYPRRDVGKKPAFIEWQKAIKREDPEIIIAGAHRYSKDPNLPELRYVPHAERWLKNDRWADEPLPPRFNNNSIIKTNNTGNAISLAKQLRDEETRLELGWQ